MFDRLTNGKQPLKKNSGVGAGMFKRKKDSTMANSGSSGALGFRKGNGIKTPSNALGASGSASSLGFHAGKVNQTIYSGRDAEDSSSQVEEHKGGF